MEFISYAILDQVKEEIFPLKFQDYCFYGALYFHIKYSKNVKSDFNQLPLFELKNVVPDSIYKNNNEQEWFDTTRKIIKMLSDKLESLSVKKI